MDGQPESRHDLSPVLLASIYEGKTFSADWTSGNFPLWATLLKPYCGTATRIIEVGCWEGLSALFFLNYLPRASLVCIDTFDTTVEPLLTIPSPKLAEFGIDWTKFDSNLERRFDANVAGFGERLEKIRASSNVALAELGIDGRKFDVAYIDGSHRSVDVYCDAVLMWPMMVQGGMIIFDDYQWGYMPGTREHPKLGIDCFLHAFEGQYRILH